MSDNYNRQLHMRIICGSYADVNGLMFFLYCVPYLVLSNEFCHYNIGVAFSFYEECLNELIVVQTQGYGEGYNMLPEMCYLYICH